MNRYLHCALERKIPFFVILGLRGTPRSPEYVFCIPLSKAEYPELYLSVLKKYNHDPDKNFFWMSGALR